MQCVMPYKSMLTRKEIDMVFTFWEGEMPAYIQLCLDTWKFPYIVLNYETLSNYTDLKADDKLKRFSLPQIADAVRVHILRDNGGYWLDTDTISITGELPKETILGYPDTRVNTIGFLHTDKNSTMFRKWAEYQDKILSDLNPSMAWYIMGNGFTDNYLRDNHDIQIAPVENRWAETYSIPGTNSRYSKYQRFYFNESHSIQELKPTDLLMLHNSWTPRLYKELSREQVLTKDCTLSNILRELL